MSTVVLGEQPVVKAWLDRRRALGQDVFDEVWEGDYHVAPNARAEHAAAATSIMVVLAPHARRTSVRGIGPFNLGVDRNDYRVPDGGWLRGEAKGLYVPTAAVVLEVLSPDDETFAKFDFYARHGVEEILVAHPTERWVRCYAHDGHAYQQVEGSTVLGVSMESLAAEVDWP